MAQGKSFDILYTALQLPRDIVERMVTLQRDKRVSVSQITSEAVIQYISKLPEEGNSFCKECSAFLPDSDFYMKNGKPFKLCKKHHKARSVQWMREHRELVYERNRHYARRKKATA